MKVKGQGEIHYAAERKRVPEFCSTDSHYFATTVNNFSASSLFLEDPQSDASLEIFFQ